ncbi:hypothetical protein FRC03_007549 [Tulasnella sp. 419]|nr:hypothetical protein FRC03_007549 [Tulasnella sp. 419]
MAWKDVVQRKQADRERRVRDFAAKELASASDADPDMRFLTATVSEIVKRIEQREDGWTAVNVLLAYIRRATLAHENTNCLTEILYKEALEEAHELDREFARTKKIKGPLHGVPISFKDNFHIKGHDTSLGFTKWSFKTSEEDAELVQHIRSLGGIPFVKTNVPQFLLSFECNNPVFGRTTNPWNEKYTSGGSSGGEGALLACDGSPLGFGSDIGGSLRIPASYCGIYSFKPSIGRVNTGGMRATAPGFESLIAVAGPMARSVEDVELGCKLIFNDTINGPQNLPAVPYKDAALPEKLKFGYYKSDGLIKASPACQRAVQESVDALRKAGHECVEFEFPDILECTRLFVALTSADGYSTLLSHKGPDPKDSSLFLVTLGPSLPGWLRRLAATLVELAKDDKIFATLMRNSRVRSVREKMVEAHKRDEYRKFFYREVWDKFGFDGIIAPVQAMPCLPHKATTTLSPLAAATFIYNVVDQPIGVVPVTRVQADKDALTDEWRSSGAPGSVIFSEELYQGKSPVYDPAAMEGIPVGVQVVGKSWEDEKVVGMMRVLDEALGSRGFGPGSWNSSKAP